MARKCNKIHQINFSNGNVMGFLYTMFRSPTSAGKDTISQSPHHKVSGTAARPKISRLYRVDVAF